MSCANLFQMRGELSWSLFLCFRLCPVSQSFWQCIYRSLNNCSTYHVSLDPTMFGSLQETHLNIPSHNKPNILHICCEKLFHRHGLELISLLYACSWKNYPESKTVFLIWRLIIKILPSHKKQTKKTTHLVMFSKYLMVLGAVHWA